MNKDELFKLQNQRDNLLNIFMYIAIGFGVMVFLSIFLPSYLTDFVNIQESQLSELIYNTSIILVTVASCFIMSVLMSTSKKIDAFISKNQHDLLHEGIEHTYEIIDLTIIENENRQMKKLPCYQTKSFKEETKLIEVIYVKEGVKHKLVTKASVLNHQPTKIKYLKFKDSLYYKNNVMYDIICE